jgi:hypothetical protein
MSGQTMIKKVGRTLAKKILKKGDIYVAVSILISIGECYSPGRMTGGEHG